MSLIRIDNTLIPLDYQPIVKNDNSDIIDFESIEILYDIQQLSNKYEFYVGLLGKNIDENIKYLYDSTGIFKELNITKEDLDRSLEGVYDITYESLIEKIKDTAKKIIKKIIELINTAIQRIRDVVRKIYEFIFPSQKKSDFETAANIVEQIQQNNDFVKIKGFELNKLYRRIEFYSAIIKFFESIMPATTNQRSGAVRLLNVSELEQMATSGQINNLQSILSNLRTAYEQQFKKYGDIVKFNVKDFRIKLNDLKSKEITINKNNDTVSKSCILNIAQNYQVIIPKLEQIQESLKSMNQSYSDSSTLSTTNNAFLTSYFNILATIIRNMTLISVAAANDAQRFKITCDNIIKSKIER